MDEGIATGRLFRSLHACGDQADQAIVALDLNEVVRLRSVSLAPDASPSVDAARSPELDPDFAHLFSAGLSSSRPPDDQPPSFETDDAISVEVMQPAHRRLAAGIPAWTAVALISGVTLLMGIADVFVTGQIGWLTGIALVLVSAYAAAAVKPQDGYWVIVSPPLAFLLTTLTVGQLTITGGSFWVRQGLLIPFTLGRAALWILAATILAALVVGVRRRKVLQSTADL